MDLNFVNISELSDMEMATYMRKTNYEKFKSLVRMHLSFELDLNTDEFDLPCHEIVYEEKGKVKKWNRLSKKHKLGTGGTTTGCTSSGKQSMNGGNGSPTETINNQIDSGFMFHLKELKEFLLMDKNIKQEGIFRKTGSISRQNELRQKIQQEKPLELEKCGYSAHDCATVFKSYLGELSEPLLTDAHYPAHLQIEPLCLSTTFRPIAGGTGTLNKSEALLIERQKREQHLLNSVQLLLLLLPEDNRELLQHIIEMLNKVAQHEESNKMSGDNLATLFAPHLICPRNLPPEALHYVARKMSNIIAYMIIRGMDIFDIPAKLATDIKAYFLERKRKKTMSPEQMLDESISDVSTVNTVYTFVNREMTAAAHHANTTETELAQLYAHIQSLPESSRKRRLIKQFNKQNGQGTPQLMAANQGNKTGKSIGDSIKKHIFHKGLMSRTPKRPIPPSTLGNETPSFSSTKNPKLRVLFQSPVSHNTSITTNANEASGFVNTLTACCNSNSSSSTSISLTTNTPYQLKSHPLQKSISSMSLLQNNQTFKSSSKRALHNPAFVNDDGDCHSLNSNSSSSCANSSNNSDDLLMKSGPGNSKSAPVSRQTSDINSQDCVTPLKLITDVAKHLVSHNPPGNEKKSVAWDEENLYEIDEFSNPNTPIQQNKNNHNISDLKSRYKSEPNLSKILKEKMLASQEVTTPISHKHTSSHKSLTRKLIKGVSMGNLKFSFATPDTTKRLVRSVSTTLKRRTSEETHGNQGNNDASALPLLTNVEEHYDLDNEDEDDERPNIPHEEDEEENDNDEDETFENDIVDGLNENQGSSGNSNSSDMASCSGATSYQHLLLQQSGLYRNLNLITSTPSLLLGRRSMSPITKSTQRMPKAMQESIMTPRSRKPVMVLTTANGSSDQNQTIYQNDFSSFPEQDEHGLSLEDVNTLNNVSTNDSDNIDKDEEDLSQAYQTQRFCSLEIHSEDANLVGSSADDSSFKKIQSFKENSTLSVASIPTIKVSDDDDDDDVPEDEGAPEATNMKSLDKSEALSNNFKNYLIRRSALKPDQEDSTSSILFEISASKDEGDSFSFHSTPDIENLNESKLSPSLLYCLDGNKPDDDDDEDNLDIDSEVCAGVDIDEGVAVDIQNADTKSNNSILSFEEDISFEKEEEEEPVQEPQNNDSINSGISNKNDNHTNRLSSNPFIILNNARKRAATNDLEKHPYVFVNNTVMSTLKDHQSAVVGHRKILTKSSTKTAAHEFVLSPTTTPNTSATKEGSHDCSLTTSRPTRSEKTTATTISPNQSNKENISHKDIQNYVLSKKLLISEYPGETKI